MQKAIVVFVMLFFTIESYAFNHFFPFFNQQKKPVVTAPQETKTSLSGLSKRKTNGGSTVSISITNPDSLKFLSNPYVSLLDTFGFAVVIERYAESNSTNSWGLFIDGVYPGAYLLKVQFGFDENSRIIYSGNTEDINNAQWIHLTSGSNTVQCVIPPDNKNDSVVITGKCFDKKSGALLTNAYITIGLSSPGTSNTIASQSKYIDNTGNYKITFRIKPDNYIVKASIVKSNSNYCSQYWDGSFSNQKPIPITLAKNNTKDFYFVHGSTISGVAMEVGGDTLHSSISIYLIDESKNEIAHTYIYTSDKKDTFSIDSVPHGTFKLFASSSGYYKKEYYSGTSFSDAQLITISNDTVIKSITFAMQKDPSFFDFDSMKQATVKGKVISKSSGKPVANCKIYASISLHPYFKVTQTDTSGKFTISIPAQKEVTVGVYSTSGVSDQDYYLCMEWTGDEYAQKPLKVLTLAPDEQYNLEFSLPDGGSLAGHFLSANKSKIDIKDNAFPFTYLFYAIGKKSGFVYGSIGTELDGFRFNGLPADTYSVSSSFFQSDTSNEVEHMVKKNYVVNNLMTTDAGSISMKPATSAIHGTISNYCETFAIMAVNVDSVYQSGLILGGMPNFLKDGSYTVSLPAGKYALLMCYYKDNLSNYNYTWYGSSDALTPTDVFHIDNPYKLIIPKDAKWITVGDNQTVSDVNFNLVSAVVKSKSSHQKPSCSIIQNAGNTIIQYDFKGAENAGIEIVGLNGKLLKRFKVNKNEGCIRWNSGHCAMGICFVKLQSKNNCIIKKFTSF